MEEVGIIGHRGFIGSFLHFMYPRARVFSSETISEMGKYTFQLVFCAAPGAEKYKALQSPETDWKQTTRLMSDLKTVNTDRFVLLSTIDVFSREQAESSLTTESTPPHPDHPYGQHRYQLEVFVRQRWPEAMIIRLPGLFGMGLKKNEIYDEIQVQLGRSVRGPDRNRQTQYYHLHWLAADLKKILFQHVPVVHLFTEPVQSRDWREIKEVKEKEEKEQKDTNYNVSSNVYKLRTKEVVCREIKKFIRDCTSAAIQVSDLGIEEIGTYRELERYGVRTKEIAPYKFFGPDFINQSLSWFDRYKTDAIYSFQALLYPNQFTIFADDITSMIFYLYRLGRIGHYLGVKKFIFGNAAARKIPPGMAESEITKKATDFLSGVTKALSGTGIMFLIEPNMGADLWKTVAETDEFIREYCSVQEQIQCIGFVLDTANLIEQQQQQQQQQPPREENYIYDLVRKYSARASHIHFSLPGMGPLYPASPSATVNFAFLYDMIMGSGYRQKITIEMQSTSDRKIALSDILFSVRSLHRKKLHIRGAGWYGVHALRFLTEQGLDCTIWDPAGIFTGSSRYNQNRLHMGLHYARNTVTRNLCIDTYTRFRSEYSNLLLPVPGNTYAISNESHIDLGTYKTILNGSGIQFRSDSSLVVPYHLLNTEGVIESDEMFIDAEAAAEFATSVALPFFANQPQRSEISYLVDCTGNSEGKIPNMRKEYFTSLVYETIHPLPFHAVTVIDGPFFSLYPYHRDGRLYTLTDVEFGARTDLEIAERERLSTEKVRKYIPDFSSYFRLSHSFVSVKQKPERGYASANRSVQTEIEHNHIFISCGKISGIYIMQDEILEPIVQGLKIKS